MRYLDSTFGSLLKPIDRRWFAAVVDRYDEDAYDHRFKRWDHLVTLKFAQSSGPWNRLAGPAVAKKPSACLHKHKRGHPTIPWFSAKQQSRNCTEAMLLRREATWKARSRKTTRTLRSG